MLERTSCRSTPEEAAQRPINTRTSRQEQFSECGNLPVPDAKVALTTRLIRDKPRLCEAGTSARTRKLFPTGPQNSKARTYVVGASAQDLRIARPHVQDRQARVGILHFFDRPSEEPKE